MITHTRLRNQRLSSMGFTTPGDVVSWLGAVQAQDYSGAKWALGLRMPRATDAIVERAFAAGDIVRTHVMRPTWHFVAPADIRWLLALTAPRVRAAVARYDGRLGIDASLITRSNKVIAAALSGVQLTRSELKTRLQKTGLAVDGVQRLAHLMMYAELDALICSGALRGKQFTYALLDERVPQSKPLARDAALAELTRRYFTSHGPATVQDFAWWSGLTTADARAGLDMVQRDLVEDVIDGNTYWLPPSTRRVRGPSRTAFLLPLYDEYLIAYKDRRAALDPAFWKPIAARDPFSAAIVLDGRVVGGWKRTVTKGKVAVAVHLPVPLSRADSRLVAGAVRRFGAFLGLRPAIARTPQK